MDDIVDRLAARSSDKTISKFADKINRVQTLDNRTVLNLLSNIFIAVDNSDLTPSQEIAYRSIVNQLK